VIKGLTDFHIAHLGIIISAFYSCSQRGLKIRHGLNKGYQELGKIYKAASMSETMNAE
jgi:hypothetical protein